MMRSRLEFQPTSARYPREDKADERLGGDFMQIGPWLSDRVRLRFVALAMAALLPAVAMGQGADELASTIKQSFDSIAFRIDIRPQQAATDLEAQGRQLELLEQQAPEHPEVPSVAGRSRGGARDGRERCRGRRRRHAGADRAGGF